MHTQPVHTGRAVWAPVPCRILSHCVLTCHLDDRNMREGMVVSCEGGMGREAPSAQSNLQPWPVDATRRRSLRKQVEAA